MKHISKKRFCTFFRGWALTVHPTGCPLISSLEPDPRKLMENLFSVIVSNFEKIIFFRPNYLLLVCLWQKKTFFFQKLVKMTKNYATDFRGMDSKHLVEDPEGEHSALNPKKTSKYLPFVICLCQAHFFNFVENRQQHGNICWPGVENFSSSEASKAKNSMLQPTQDENVHD